MRKALAVAAALAVIGLSLSAGRPDRALAVDEPYVVAGGDIACNKAMERDAVHCHEDATSALFNPNIVPPGALAGPGLRAILPLGDLQYPKGQLSKFLYTNTRCSIVPPFGTGPCSFNASWKAAAGSVPMMPTPGNHEYMNPNDVDPPCLLQDVTPGGTPYNACGYNKYFGDAVAAPTLDGDGKGNYFFRFDTDTAHPILFLSLNVGECQRNKLKCGATGPVVTFLRATLSNGTVNTPESCVVVYWHQARWSFYDHGNYLNADPVWKALFDFTGSSEPDLVLAGHDHEYQRFDPLGADGRQYRLPDPPPVAAIPQIVVGSGGDDLNGSQASNASTIPGPPAAADTTHFGLLKLSWSSLDGTLTASFFQEGAVAPSDTQTYACNVPPVLPGP